MRIHNTSSGTVQVSYLFEIWKNDKVVDWERCVARLEDPGFDVADDRKLQAWGASKTFARADDVIIYRNVDRNSACVLVFAHREQRKGRRSFA